MARRKQLTPDEIKAYWASDPEIAKHVAEREQRHSLRVARNVADAAPVEAALCGVGVFINSLDDIPLRPEPLRNDAVKLLLKWLGRVRETDIKHAIIAALHASKHPFDGQPLIECFEQDNEDEFLRFPIANAMACLKVTGIADWLIQAVQIKRYGTARYMLAAAVAKHVPREQAREVLLKLLDDIPGPAAAGLARFGGAEELQAIQSRVDSAAGWQRKEMEKAIRKIERRLAKQDDRRKGKHSERNPPGKNKRKQ